MVVNMYFEGEGIMSHFQWHFSTFRLWTKKHPLRWAFAKFVIVVVIAGIVAICVP